MRKLVLVGLICLAVSVVASTASAAKPSLAVAVTRSADAAALYLGAKQGLFSGAAVTPRRVASEAAAIEAVVSGKAQFGLASAFSLLVAQANGQQVRAVAGATAYTPNLAGLVVSSSSQARAAADLSGKLGVPASGSFAELATYAWVDANDGVSTNLEPTQVAPATAAAALKSGQLDVAYLPQPYLAAALKAGARSLGDPGAVFGANATTSLYFTSAAYLSKHAATAKAFVAGIKSSSAYATKNKSAVAGVLAAAGVPASTAVPRFSATINVASLDDLAGTIDGYTFTDAAPDVEVLVWRAAPVAK